MDGCWAKALGGCSNKLSREHLVSAALFPGKYPVDVFGFPWCNGETKRIGLANLTSKILCTFHNNSLSPLDIVAGNAFQAFNDSAALANKRVITASSKFKIRHFHINGHLLERWLLKTLINLSYGSEYFIGRGAQSVDTPDETLIKICFGLEHFSGKSGLYLASRRGAQIKSAPTLEFSPLIFDGSHIQGGFFHFRGFLLFLSLFEEQLPNNFNWVRDLNNLRDWDGVEPTWHFKKINFDVNGVRSHVVQFKW